MAERSGESPRRIRSRLEKEGMTEQITTQILERKVIDRILQSSTVEDDVTASAEPEVSVETLDHAAGGGGRSPGGRGGDRRRSETSRDRRQRELKSRWPPTTVQS